MTSTDRELSALVERAADGDNDAVERLLSSQRARLRRMVEVRLDPRLAGRMDPSDIVQDVLMDAVRRLPEYLRSQPVPFYIWLRQIGLDRLVDIHRRHVEAQRRSVAREEVQPLELSDKSTNALVDRFVAQDQGPLVKVVKKEIRRRARAAIDQLPVSDREVLALRYLEHLSTSEIASALGVTEGVVKGRHRRAIERLNAALGDLSGESNV